MDWQDMNARQRDILVALATNPPQSGSELARQLGVDQSTAERNLATLRDNALVTGDRDHSQRGAPIQNVLTPEGRELVRENIVEPAREIQE